VGLEVLSCDVFGAKIMTNISFTRDSMFRDYRFIFIDNSIYTIAFSIPRPSSNPPPYEGKIKGWVILWFCPLGMENKIIV